MKMERTGKGSAPHAGRKDLGGVAAGACFSESWSGKPAEIQPGTTGWILSGLRSWLGTVPLLRSAHWQMKAKPAIVADPAFKGRGSPGKLMESMAAVARMKGAREVALEVRMSKQALAPGNE